MSDEEIKTVVAEAESAGVIETGERRMIAGVLRLGDRDARGIMTPRTDVDWIDLEDDEAVTRQTLTDSAHSRLPVADGDPDNVLGVVQSRDLLAAMLAGKPLDIRAHLKPAPVVPDTIDALNVLTTLRDAETVAGFVISQFGRIPATGESAIMDDWRFEIVDLDGRRVDKVLAMRSE